MWDASDDWRSLLSFKYAEPEYQALFATGPGSRTGKIPTLADSQASISRYSLSDRGDAFSDTTSDVGYAVGKRGKRSSQLRQGIDENDGRPLRERYPAILFPPPLRPALPDTLDGSRFSFHIDDVLATINVLPEDSEIVASVQFMSGVMSSLVDKAVEIRRSLIEHAQYIYHLNKPLNDEDIAYLEDTVFGNFDLMSSELQEISNELAVLQDSKVRSVFVDDGAGTAEHKFYPMERAIVEAGQALQQEITSSRITLSQLQDYTFSLSRFPPGPYLPAEGNKVSWDGVDAWKKAVLASRTPLAQQFADFMSSKALPVQPNVFAYLQNPAEHSLLLVIHRYTFARGEFRAIWEFLDQQDLNIGDAADSILRTMRGLVVTASQLSDRDVHRFAQSLSRLRSLALVNFMDNQLTYSAIASLATNIFAHEGCGRALHLLYLDRNRINAEGVVLLSQILGCLPYLHKLSLRGNSQIGDAGVHVLLRAMVNPQRRAFQRFPPLFPHKSLRDDPVGGAGARRRANGDDDEEEDEEEEEVVLASIEQPAAATPMTMRAAPRASVSALLRPAESTGKQHTRAFRPNPAASLAPAALPGAASAVSLAPSSAAEERWLEGDAIGQALHSQQRYPLGGYLCDFFAPPLVLEALTSHFAALEYELVVSGQGVQQQTDRSALRPGQYIFQQQQEHLQRLQHKQQQAALSAQGSVSSFKGSGQRLFVFDYDWVNAHYEEFDLDETLLSDYSDTDSSRDGDNNDKDDDDSSDEDDVDKKLNSTALQTKRRPRHHQSIAKRAAVRRNQRTERRTRLLLRRLRREWETAVQEFKVLEQDQRRFGMQAAQQQQQQPALPTLAQVARIADPVQLLRLITPVSPLSQTGELPLLRLRRLRDHVQSLAQQRQRRQLHQLHRLRTQHDSHTFRERLVLQEKHALGIDEAAQAAENEELDRELDLLDSDDEFWTPAATAEARKQAATQVLVQCLQHVLRQQLKWGQPFDVFMTDEDDDIAEEDDDDNNEDGDDTVEDNDTVVADYQQQQSDSAAALPRVKSTRFSVVSTSSDAKKQQQARQRRSTSRGSVGPSAGAAAVRRFSRRASSSSVMSAATTATAAATGAAAAPRVTTSWLLRRAEGAGILANKYPRLVRMFLKLRLKLQAVSFFRHLQEQRGYPAPTLAALDLADTGLTAAVLPAVSVVLRENNCLLQLDVSGNPQLLASTEACLVLSQGLKYTLAMKNTQEEDARRWFKPWNPHLPQTQRAPQSYRHVWQHSSLQVLALNDTGIRDPGVLTLLAALTSTAVNGTSGTSVMGVSGALSSSAAGGTGSGGSSALYRLELADNLLGPTAYNQLVALTQGGGRQRWYFDTAVLETAARPSAGRAASGASRPAPPPPRNTSSSTSSSSSAAKMSLRELSELAEGAHPAAAPAVSAAQTRSSQQHHNQQQTQRKLKPPVFSAADFDFHLDPLLLIHPGMLPARPVRRQESESEDEQAEDEQDLDAEDMLLHGKIHKHDLEHAAAAKKAKAGKKKEAEDYSRPMRLVYESNDEQADDDTSFVDRDDDLEGDEPEAEGGGDDDWDE